MNAQMSEKKVVGRNVAIASGIICILLAVSLVGAIANYTSIISAKDNTITSKDSAIDNLNSQITSKNSLIAENNNTISSLNSQISSQRFSNTDTHKPKGSTANMAKRQRHVSERSNSKSPKSTQLLKFSNSNSPKPNFIEISLLLLVSKVNCIRKFPDQLLNSTVTALQSQVNDLTAIINMSKSKLQTLVFHVCEKGEGYEWGHIPDVNYTYNQILALNNNTYNVLLLPEYKGHENWTEELAWITANFGGQHGIPIMLDVFGGGNGSYSYPDVVY